MSERISRAVIVHGGGVDPNLLVHEAGINPPVSIRSFTNGGVHDAEELREAASQSDHLLIEESLWRMSEDAIVAEKFHSALGERRSRTARLFEDEKVTLILSAAGYNIETLRSEIASGAEAMK